jgi:formate hydrogenlyase transcriptional activator
MVASTRLDSELPSLGEQDLRALLTIVEGTANSTGDAYFKTLVQCLAEAVGARHAFVTEFKAPHTICTIAYWSNGTIVPNYEFDLRNTPCEEVIGGGLCFYPQGLMARYPETHEGMDSYLGVPLKARDGAVMGHVAVFDEGRLPGDPQRLALFRIFAARAAAELERIRMDQQLNDLFDEAPIAYVHEGLDTRFIRANRAARRVLGISEAEVTTMRGASLIPDTPDAQRRLREAFESLGKGTDTSGVVLELRRKDNGKPIWIQWWSKPDSSGSCTRTMFIDITDRVLMEQEQNKLKAQNSYLQEEIKSVHNFEEIIGASAGLLKVLDKVRRVAPTDASVLILGESGTGKELIARAIHSASGRADKPFIKVNCAALPTSLVESELFGHERGAFSGAIQRRIGRFELAHGGTIFLDEIGEVPMDVQVKLLRVLQEREFERIGSNQPLHTDVRVIAATNRDLPKAIREGEFRADLFYRLNVFPVELPPLRERQQDIPLLVQFFVQKYAGRVGRRLESVGQQTMARLTAYSWPGNIRELENIVERALILSSSPVLEIDPEVLGILATTTPGSNADADEPTLPGLTRGPAPRGGEADAADLDSVQRGHILAMLRDTNWVIEGQRGAAARLGMKPGTLRHRMKKLGISRGED